VAYYWWYQYHSLRNPTIDDMLHMSMESYSGLILTEENRRTRRGTCPSATLSTTNPVRIDLGAYPGLHSHRAAANHLSLGIAWEWTWEPRGRKGNVTFRMFFHHRVGCAIWSVGLDRLDIVLVSSITGQGMDVCLRLSELYTPVYSYARPCYAPILRPVSPTKG
jgi:hypothetical protein